jgi:hypothetical protein
MKNVRMGSFFFSPWWLWMAWVVAWTQSLTWASIRNECRFVGIFPGYGTFSRNSIQLFNPLTTKRIYHSAPCLPPKLATLPTNAKTAKNGIAGKKMNRNKSARWIFIFHQNFCRATRGKKLKTAKNQKFRSTFFCNSWMKREWMRLKQ